MRKVLDTGKGVKAKGVVVDRQPVNESMKMDLHYTKGDF